jgi:hypothetical protein
LKTRTCGTCAKYKAVLGICGKTKRTVNAQLKPVTPCWKAKRRGKVKVYGDEPRGYLCAVKLSGVELYSGICRHRKTANRQARRIAAKLGIEVEA